VRRVRSGTVPVDARPAVQLQPSDSPANQARRRQDGPVQPVPGVAQTIRDGHVLRQASRGAQPEHDHSLSRSVFIGLPKGLSYHHNVFIRQETIRELTFFFKVAFISIIINDKNKLDTVITKN